MRSAASVNMIDRQKLGLGFATTCACIAVVRNDLISNTLAPFTHVLSVPAWMLSVPFAEIFGLFTRILFTPFALTQSRCLHMYIISRPRDSLLAEEQRRQGPREDYPLHPTSSPRARLAGNR